MSTRFYKEEVGFEPTERLHVRQFSRLLRSTALALLQNNYSSYHYSSAKIIIVKPFIYLCYNMNMEKIRELKYYNLLKNVFIFLVFAFIAGIVSIFKGMDRAFDVRNYHIYNPYAFLHNRYSQDIMPADIQSYFNPIIDIPHYFLVRVLNDHPFVVTFLEGLGYAFLLFMIYKISEFVFQELKLRADLAIVEMDFERDSYYVGDYVSDIVAIIEIKETSGTDFSTTNWVKNDIQKFKRYLQEGHLNCQCYFAVIYEEECSTLRWMDKRTTNKWAKGYVTELDAGYIDGKMRFEVNSYNNLNLQHKRIICDIEF